MRSGRTTQRLDDPAAAAPGQQALWLVVLVTGLDFALVAILLLRFTAIGGWIIAKVIFLCGALVVAFSLAELAVAAFDQAPLRPLSPEAGDMTQRPPRPPLPAAC